MQNQITTNLLILLLFKIQLTPQLYHQVIVISRIRDTKHHQNLQISFVQINKSLKIIESNKQKKNQIKLISLNFLILSCIAIRIAIINYQNHLLAQDLILKQILIPLMCYKEQAKQANCNSNKKTQTLNRKSNSLKCFCQQIKN
ncbi:transmembrane protein, putative (macronuclear) [Tetrahymena thermophila SB210]|uniref:Transmembrane protein, putative n=1 Tax=Tetrahymena thermophila (strain SB210) TaxID=312017 RepID=W7X3Y2_TETTS|nr:transmembrane protein, putative [Tetrahymena thermophila SB210]EWS72147.1 transmembrane protein, putative [Tetrahymena thermophila SB210]|eukprot:XP_012655309.1 transmembrane protein, putative [Tetrahymena thermophila SB210]